MVSSSLKFELSISKKRKLTVVAGLIVLLVAAVFGVMFGATDISLSDILKLISGQEIAPDVRCIFFELRLPRVITAVLVGAAFAVSGAVMQALTQNPLASPSLAGLNAGSSLALLVALVFLPEFSIETGIVASAIGSAIGVTLVFTVSLLARSGNSPAGFALSGLIVSMFLSSITTGIVHANNMSYELSFWTMGGLEAIRWEHVKLLLPIVFAGIAFLMFLSPGLTAVSLGNETATGLGVNVWRVRRLSLLAVFVLVGASVAIVGPVGFVGLMVPHIARKLTGVSYSIIIPVSALLGGVLVLICDTLSRYLTASAISAGVFTTFIGGSFFVYLAYASGKPKKRKPASEVK